MFGMLVGGYLLTRPVDDGSAQSIASQVGFNHPQKYQEIHGGPGPQALSASAQAWSSRIGGKFDSIAQRLEEATSKAGVAWEGAAAEAHGNSMAPLSSFVRDAKDVSTAVGTSTEHQVDNYTGVRDSMPEPKKVTATDSLLEKGGAALFGTQTDLQRQEQEALERAQEAQRIYGNYDTGSGNVSSSLPRYPEAPKLQYTDQPAGGGGGRVGVDSGGGYTGSNISSGDGTYSGGGSGSAGNGSGVNPSGGTGGSSSGGSGGGSGGSDGPPAGSDSAWTTPPPVTGGPALVPPGTGTGTGTGGPGGGGALGVIGRGAGGGTGRGGSGSGYGRGGSGSGVGGRSGSGSGLGAGGRSGSGLGGRSGMPSTSSAYSSSTSSTAARGGMMGGAGARGAQGEEDEEHENKYMVETDEAWEDLDLPRTAPPVIGGDLEPPQR